MSKRCVLGTVAVVAAAVVAIVPFALRRTMRRPRGHVFDSDGVELHYTVTGTGTPVVLLHGFAVNAELNWRLPGFAPKVVEQRQVIMIDLRGHGASGHPGTYGIEMVDDVVRLLDHLDIQRAHIAGYSLGGVITLKLAVTHPERLLSAAALGSGWENPDNSMFLGAIDEIAVALESGRGVGPLAEHLGGDREAPGIVHQMWVRLMTGFFNDGPALGGVVRGIPELVVEEEDLGRISAPVCSIVAVKDPMRSGSEALEGRVDDLLLHVIDGADHLTATRHPEMISTYLDFLDRVERETSPS